MDLNAVIQETLVLLDVEARRFNVTVDLEFDETLAQVEADRLQVQQVILNLARNGMEAMQNQQNRAHRLTIGTSVNGSGEARVSVRDTGEGMSREVEAQAFEPYFTTKQDGVGLGLPLCRTFIEESGGRLWNRQEADGGISFFFTLPFAR